MRGGIYNLHPVSYLCILQPSHASYPTSGERMRKRRRRKRKRRRRKRSLHLSLAPLGKLMRGGIYSLPPVSYPCILQLSHASYSTIASRHISTSKPIFNSKKQKEKKKKGH